MTDTPETFDLDAWLSGASRPQRSVRIYQRFYHEMKKIVTARSAEEKREAVALTSHYTGLMHLCGDCKRLLVRFPPCEKKRPALRPSPWPSPRVWNQASSSST